MPGAGQHVATCVRCAQSGRGRNACAAVFGGSVPVSCGSAVLIDCLLKPIDEEGTRNEGDEPLRGDKSEVGIARKREGQAEIGRVGGSEGGRVRWEGREGETVRCCVRQRGHAWSCSVRSTAALLGRAKHRTRVHMVCMLAAQSSYIARHTRTHAHWAGMCFSAYVS